MKPSEARILHIDDSEFSRNRVSKHASTIGATVTASAATYEEALVHIAMLKELGITVVLTDDTLSEEEPYQGRLICDLLAAEHPDIPVLSVSGSEGLSRALEIPHIPHKGTDLSSFLAAIEAL